MTTDRARRRAEHPLTDEVKAGSADPLAQAEVILEESDLRQEDRDAAPDTVLEKRRSEDTVDLT